MKAIYLFWQNNTFEAIYYLAVLFLIVVSEGLLRKMILHHLNSQLAENYADDKRKDIAEISHAVYSKISICMLQITLIFLLFTVYLKTTTFYSVLMIVVFCIFLVEIYVFVCLIPVDKYYSPINQNIRITYARLVTIGSFVVYVIQFLSRVFLQNS
jgi:hypothetical protein